MIPQLKHIIKLIQSLSEKEEQDEDAEVDKVVEDEDEIQSDLIEEEDLLDGIIEEGSGSIHHLVGD